MCGRRASDGGIKANPWTSTYLTQRRTPKPRLMLWCECEFFNTFYCKLNCEPGHPMAWQTASQRPVGAEPMERVARRGSVWRQGACCVCVCLQVKGLKVTWVHLLNQQNKTKCNHSVVSVTFRVKDPPPPTIYYQHWCHFLFTVLWCQFVIFHFAAIFLHRAEQRIA